MELYDIMRTTFAAREFTDAPVSDETLYKILENARFAPSGGNRQGARVIVVRDPATREKLVALATPAAKRYIAQINNGESPWNAVSPPKVDAETIEQTQPPSLLLEPYRKAPVVLIICVDLQVVASIDQHLDRVGIISGGSIYPFAWNILMAARHEGYGGTITTLPVVGEPQLQEHLGLPSYMAVAAVIPLGKPVKQLTKLKRKPVEDFVMMERWKGAPLKGN